MRITCVRVSSSAASAGAGATAFLPLSFRLSANTAAVTRAATPTPMAAPMRVGRSSSRGWSAAPEGEAATAGRLDEESTTATDVATHAPNTAALLAVRADPTAATKAVGSALMFRVKASTEAVLAKRISVVTVTSGLVVDGA